MTMLVLGLSMLRIWMFWIKEGIDMTMLFPRYSQLDAMMS